MKTCENCSSLNDGNYGSGRFCSSACARGFSTKNKRIEINKKVSNSLIGKNSHTGQKAIFHQKICKCGIKFIVEQSKREQMYCSKSCAQSHKIVSNKTKKKISDSVKKLYDDGKLVYGGTTKWLTVMTSNGEIRVQGTFELRACKILDKLKHDSKIKNWEYTNDRIEYVGIDNKTHNYLLDFKIINNDGSFYYLEIKGYERANDKLKWEAVSKAGYELKVWFNKQLNEYER